MFLELLDHVADFRGGGELAVDEDVKQPVDQVANVDIRLVGVPSGYDRVQVNWILAHGDQRAGKYEGAELFTVEARVTDVEGDGVQVGEQVRPVTVELGPLVGLEGVLDRQRMQVEFLG